MKFTELFTAKQFITKLGALRFGTGLFDENVARTPHEEMELATQAYLTRPQVNSGIDQLALFVVGNDISIESSDKKTEDFLNKWLEQRDRGNQEIRNFVISALVTGNAYFENTFAKTPNGSLVLDNVFTITDSARVFRNLASDEHDKWWIYEVPTELKTYPFSNLFGEMTQMHPKFWFINYVLASSVVFRRSVYGIPIDKAKISHFKWGWSRDMIYGRSFLMSVIDDTDIIKEIVKNWSIIARYRALNAKIISVGDAENPATVEDIETLRSDFDAKRDSEHIILNKPHEINSLSNVGEYDDMSAPVDWLRRDVTSGLVPNYLTPWNSDINRATSEEVRVVFEYRLESMREELVAFLDKAIIDELRKEYTWLAKDATFKFGEIDFDSKSEKLQFAGDLFDRNIITVNEYRELVGLEALPSDSGNQFAKDVQQTYGNMDAFPGVSIPDAEPPQLLQSPEGFREGATPELRSAEDDLADEAFEQVDSALVDSVDSFFKQFDKKKRKTSEAFASSKSVDSLEKTMQGFDKKVSSIATDVFAKVLDNVHEGTGALDTKVDKKVDKKLSKALMDKAAMLQKNFDAQLKQYNKKKVQDVRRLILDGVVRGLSHAEIKKQVKEVIDKYKRKENPQDWEVQRIIRTEIGKSTNLLRLLKWQEQGFEKFIWVTMNDNRVRPLHAKRHMKSYKIADALQGKAPLTDDSFPGVAINCRCTAMLDPQ